MNPQQQQRKQLRHLFETNTEGYIFLSQLKKISPSDLMIRDIARYYDYMPVYRNKASTKIVAYKHHTITDDIFLNWR